MKIIYLSRCITAAVSFFYLRKFKSLEPATKRANIWQLYYSNICQKRKGNIWCTPFYDLTKLAKWNFGKSSRTFKLYGLSFHIYPCNRFKILNSKKVRVIQICVKANLDLGDKFPRSDNLDRWAEKSIWYTCGLWLTADFWANHRLTSRVLALLVTKIQD